MRLDELSIDLGGLTRANQASILNSVGNYRKLKKLLVETHMITSGTLHSYGAQMGDTDLSEFCEARDLPLLHNILSSCPNLKVDSNDLDMTELTKIGNEERYQAKWMLAPRFTNNIFVEFTSTYSPMNSEKYSDICKRLAYIELV